MKRKEEEREGIRRRETKRGRRRREREDLSIASYIQEIKAGGVALFYWITD